MSIFSRLFKIGQAHTNRMVDHLEKPEVMLEQALRDKEKAIKDAMEKVQSVIATERQTRAQITKAEQEKLKWDERAQYALEKNDEKLALQALQRSEEHAGHISTLTPTWNLQRDSIDSLKIELQKMQDEINELKRNKDILIAQSKTAEVRKAIYDAKNSMKRNDSTDLITRMKNKAEKQIYEAEAAKELSESFTKEDSLENQFAQIDNSGADIKAQARLAAMKEQLKLSK